MGSVILVRHGEAEGNRHHRLIGWSIPAAIMYANSLVVTAAPLSETLGMAPVLDPRFREIDNGDWTGLTPEEVSSGWTELWQRYLDGHDVDRPGGERWADVRARVIDGLGELLACDGVTVVFSHGGPLVIAAAWASGIEIVGNVFKGPIASADNASLCTIVEGPRLLGYNDVGHLWPIASVDIPYAPVEPGSRPH